MRSQILFLTMVPLLLGTRGGVASVTKPLPELKRSLHSDAATESVVFTVGATTITADGNYSYTICTSGVTTNRYLDLYIGSTRLIHTERFGTDGCAGVTNVSVDAYTPNFTMYGYIIDTSNGAQIASTSLPVTVSIFQAGISGPPNIHEGDTPTYDGLVMKTGNSVGPYTYAWSGILSGSGSSVTGSPSASGYLYLTITDSQSRQSSVYEYVYVCPVGENVC